MKRIFLLIVVYSVLVKCATGINKPADIKTYAYQPYSGVDSGYNFEYENRNGRSRKPERKLVTNAENQRVLDVTGFYSFLDTKGSEHRVQFEADEYGYRQLRPDIVRSLIGG